MGHGAPIFDARLTQNNAKYLIAITDFHCAAPVNTANYKNRSKGRSLSNNLNA